MFLIDQCVIPEGIHAPLHRRSLQIKFQGGGGVLKAKLFEEKCEAKPGGERVQKNLPWGSMDIFWNYKITM